MSFALQYLWAYVHVYPQEAVERAANFMMFAAAFIISISTTLSLQAWPFFGFAIGHIIWIIVAYKMKKRTLIENMFAFLLLDIWAINIRI